MPGAAYHRCVSESLVTMTISCACGPLGIPALFQGGACER